MRIIGLLLVSTSAFFLVKNLSLSTMDDWFFGLSMLLGGLTFFSSWLPARRPTPSVPQMAPVQQNG